MLRLRAGLRQGGGPDPAEEVLPAHGRPALLPLPAPGQGEGGVTATAPPVAAVSTVVTTNVTTNVTTM